MERSWQRPLSKDGACVVFVHGFLSSAAGCWSKPGAPGWPDFVAASFPSLAVCTVTYNTEVWSGHYSISDVANSLHERLAQDGVLTSGRKLIFVCHSMGGLVVRRMLVQRRDQLAKLDLCIGLFLVASPSLGADYAKWLSPIARFLGHTQADALRFSEANLWLVDLDRDFDRLLEDKLLQIVGRELIEDRLVLLRRLWLLPRVVPAFSGGRYFADPLKIERSDHFSIAKPEGPDCLQHGALCRLIQEVTGRPAVASHTRIFISYRHTDPDQSLAVELARAFEGEGFAYFIDRRLTTGMAWQAQIAKELDACTHFVVLISEDSALSDMVRQEIAQAHRRQKQGECSILPVRVAFRGALPTDIASVLDPLQYAHWSADGSTEDLARELIGAIRGASWAPPPAPPAPRSKARLVMGTVANVSTVAEQPQAWRRTATKWAVGIVTALSVAADLTVNLPVAVPDWLKWTLPVRDLFASVPEWIYHASYLLFGAIFVYLYFRDRRSVRMPSATFLPKDSLSPTLPLAVDPPMAAAEKLTVEPKLDSLFDSYPANRSHERMVATLEDHLFAVLYITNDWRDDLPRVKARCFLSPSNEELPCFWLKETEGKLLPGDESSANLHVDLERVLVIAQVFGKSRKTWKRLPKNHELLFLSDASKGPGDGVKIELIVRFKAPDVEQVERFLCGFDAEVPTFTRQP